MAIPGGQQRHVGRTAALRPLLPPCLPARPAARATQACPTSPACPPPPPPQAYTDAAAAAGKPPADLSPEQRWAAGCALIESLGDAVSAERLRGEPNNQYRLLRVVDILLQTGGRTLAGALTQGRRGKVWTPRAGRLPPLGCFGASARVAATEGGLRLLGKGGHCCGAAWTPRAGRPLGWICSSRLGQTGGPCGSSTTCIQETCNAAAASSALLHRPSAVAAHSQAVWLQSCTGMRSGPYYTCPLLSFGTAHAILTGTLPCVQSWTWMRSGRPTMTAAASSCIFSKRTWLVYFALYLFTELDLDAQRPTDYDCRCFFLHRPRAELYRRIDGRVEEMVAGGLLTVRVL